MTYFSRLLLSRGASSAVLISNRKSRGEPRQTAGQSAATVLLLHRPRPRKKKIADQSWDDVRPAAASAAFAYAVPNDPPVIRRAAPRHTVTPHPVIAKRVANDALPIRGFISQVMDVPFFSRRT